MSNPYLSFLASLGGPTGSHSTLKKLASTTHTHPTSSSSSAAPTSKSTHQSSRDSRDHRDSRRGRPSDHGHSSSSSRRRESPSRTHSRPNKSISTSRNHDRSDSKTSAVGHGSPHPNSSRHSTSTGYSNTNSRKSSASSRDDRKRHRNVADEGSSEADLPRTGAPFYSSRDIPSEARARKRRLSKSPPRKNKSRSRSRSRSKSPEALPRQSSGPLAKSQSPERPSTPPPRTSTMEGFSTPPPRTLPQRPFFAEFDDTSSFSTLSSPSSFSPSPPPQSTPPSMSPTKELTPIKKRRIESILQAEASYSSPSSLSSPSPDRSNRTSPEREIEAAEVGENMAKVVTEDQDQMDSTTTVTTTAASTTTSAATPRLSLEMELFGAVAAPKKLESQDKESFSNTKEDGKSIWRDSSVKEVKRSSMHKGPSGSSSGRRPNKESRGREIVIIRTGDGTVTSTTIKEPRGPPKQTQGNGSVQPSKSLEPTPKTSSVNMNGAGPRRSSILHSDQIIASALNRYKNHFHMIVEDSDSTVASNPSSSGGDTMHVSLEYPGKDSREKFTLMKPFLSRSKTESDDKDEYNPIEDLVQTVRVIMEHFFSPEQYKELFGTPTDGLFRNFTKYKNRKDGAQFHKAVEEFNLIMKRQRTVGAIRDHIQQYGHRLPYELVVHILQQVYSRTVAARASKLNQYEAFSNNVYGEILPILTKEFIQRTKLNENRVFVDLGCGIGNVVLQVALQTGAESYGVEIMDTPAKFAKKQAKEFEARARAYGLHHGSVSMIQGDFLDTPELAGILARADVVLVNNYAFNSALNQSLLQLFLDLKEGCKIISLKTFVSLDHKINVRNAGSVESILRVKKYPYYTNAVSWTHNGGEYFIATVDRTAVQAFWERAMVDGGVGLDDVGGRRSSARRR